MKNKLSSFLLATISGVLLILSFPNFILPKFSVITNIIAYVSLVPLLIAITNEKPQKSFLLGLLTGFIFFTGDLYWISIIKEMGILAPYALLLFSLYLALYVGVFSLSIGFVRNKYKLIFVPLIWVCLEYLRAHFLTGFPWLTIGYSQYLNVSLLQISSITSVYGVSFLVVLINGFIAYSINGVLSNKQRFIYGPCILVVFILVLLFGHFSVKSFDENIGIPMDVSILQGNIPQDEKWERENIEPTFDIYNKLATQTKNSLILLPETAFPVYLLYDKEHLEYVLNIAKRQKSYILTGIPHATFDGYGKVDKYLNSAIFISSDGKILDRYDKTHLVPFGEFTPLKKIIGFLEGFTVGFSEFSPGTKKTVFEIDKNKKFSILICYEIIFPHLVREFVNNGALFLVNITNDAWYGKTAMSYQHLSMVMFRAVENRVYVLRAANTGVSAIITPTGKIKKYLDIFITGNIKDNIKIIHKKTFYSEFGDVFVYFCIAFSILILYKGSTFL